MTPPTPEDLARAEKVAGPHEHSHFHQCPTLWAYPKPCDCPRRERVLAIAAEFEKVRAEGRGEMREEAARVALIYGGEPQGRAIANAIRALPPLRAEAEEKGTQVGSCGVAGCLSVFDEHGHIPAEGKGGEGEKGSLDASVRGMLPAEVEEELGLLGRFPDQVVVRMATKITDLLAEITERKADSVREIAAQMDRAEAAQSALDEMSKALEGVLDVLDSYAKGVSCVACDQPTRADEGYEHLPDCEAMKARALLANRKEAKP